MQNYELFELRSVNDVKQRFPDNIRDRKNMLITLNTLCRKAAEYGHVHPIYLHEILQKYVIKIENSTNINQLRLLRKKMVRKYCLLVQSHSVKNYSKPIREAINQISLYLTSDLSLSSISRKLSLSSSYLSTLFISMILIILQEYLKNQKI